MRLSKPTILLFGTGRSGTTWLAGLLARPFRYRLLFEPDHPDHVPGADLVADRFVEPERVPGEVAHFLFRAFDDRIPSDWISQDSNRRLGMHRWRFWPAQNIVKLIRSNLTIPAVKTLFGDSVPVLLLVRQPAAVVESFLRVNFPWASQVDRLLEQSLLEEEFGVPLQALREHTGTLAGRVAIRWVAENQFLLAHSERFNIRVLSYDVLRADPATGIRQLCADLGIRTADDLDDVVRRPSHTTHPRSPVRDGDGRAGRTEALKNEDARAVRDVLDTAGVGREWTVGL